MRKHFMRQVCFLLSLVLLLGTVPHVSFQAANPHNDTTQIITTTSPAAIAIDLFTDPHYTEAELLELLARIADAETDEELAGLFIEYLGERLDLNALGNLYQRAIRYDT